MNRYRIAALVLSLVLLFIIGVQLIDYIPFSLGAPGVDTLFDYNAWSDIGTAVGSWLWSYRVIDVLVQGILLLAAVLGASAMFRHMRKEEGP